MSDVKKYEPYYICQYLGNFNAMQVVLFMRRSAIPARVIFDVLIGFGTDTEACQNCLMPLHVPDVLDTKLTRTIVHSPTGMGRTRINRDFSEARQWPLNRQQMLKEAQPIKKNCSPAYDDIALPTVIIPRIRFKDQVETCWKKKYA